MSKVVSFGLKITNSFKNCYNFRKILLQNSIKVSPSLGINFRPLHGQGKLGERKENFGKIIDLTNNDFGEDLPGINESVVKSEDELNYKKLERGSKILSTYLINVKSRKKREKTGLILLEGKRLIQDALHAGVKPVAIFFSRISDVKGLQIKDPKIQLYYTSYDDLQFWSDVTTTQGVLGIFAMPDTTTQSAKGNLPVSIICDNVRDPGNMGSIIRTAAAVGCRKLLLTKGCVDIWDPKVVRSGSGCHFRIPIHQSLTWDEISGQLTSSCKILLADSNVPGPIDVDEERLAVYELAEDGSKIPVSDEPTKRLTAYQKQTGEEVDLPLKLYSEVDYLSPKSLALIVGGETEGLSKTAYTFAVQKQGERVYLPLDNGVESLNSGTALGVMAYEIRRQRTA